MALADTASYMERLSMPKIPGALQPLADNALSPVGRLLQKLRPAQLLQAIVLSRPAPGLARVRIGNTGVDARVPDAIATGQKLLLRVEKGLPEPLLRIIDMPALASPQQRLQQHAMARQSPPAEIARQAQALQQQIQRLPDGSARPLPLLEQGLKILSPSTLEISELSSAEVRQAVQNSGLFMEAMLAGQKAIPESDRKWQLLRLLNQLRPEQRSTDLIPAGQDKNPRAMPPAGADQLLNRLMGLVESGIARIQYHQTLSLGAATQATPLFWQIDLPLQVNERREHLELKIRQENAQGDVLSAEPAWKVELRFDFHALGEVLAQITLRGSNVHCAFWSQKPGTASHFKRALPRLEQTLQNAGLQVSTISALHGTPQGEPAGIHRTLVDERA